MHFAGEDGASQHPKGEVVGSNIEDTILHYAANSCMVLMYNGLSAAPLLLGVGRDSAERCSHHPVTS